jgi:transcriptional regulator with XRE-family HTH domain
MALSYSKVIAENVRATRVRKQLLQSDVVARMRALGYGDWHRQTLGKVERGERKVSATEILGLALALGTNMGVLLGAPDNETVVELQDGQLEARDLTALAFGRNNGAVRFEENKPVFDRGVNVWRGGPDQDPARDLV